MHARERCLLLSVPKSVRTYALTHKQNVSPGPGAKAQWQRVSFQELYNDAGAELRSSVDPHQVLSKHQIPT